MPPSIENVVVLKRQTTRHAPEEQEGLALLPLVESNVERAEVAVGNRRTDALQLSVVVPAMNEEGNIAALHRAIADVLEAMGITFELILVDDGSTDGTWQAIEALHARPSGRGTATPAQFWKGAWAGNWVRGGVG
jgi:hypothetical protein